MNTDSNFINREKRFEVNELIGFDAVVSRDGTDESVFYASLIDFSRRGGKFELPFCARFDEILKIKFEFKESDLFYHGEGRVRHMRNVGENRWQVGCSLEPPLNDEVVAHLAKQTNQERRRHQRFDIFGIGKLRRQGTPDSCEAVIRNISRGGFCLIVPKEHDIGEKVDFIIDEKVDMEDPQHPTGDEKLNVGARVRWQSQTDEGYLIGCSFSDAQSYTRLVDYLVGDHQEKPDKSSWLILAAAVLAMTVPVISSIVYSGGGTQVVQLNSTTNTTSDSLQFVADDTVPQESPSQQQSSAEKSEHIESNNSVANNDEPENLNAPRPDETELVNTSAANESPIPISDKQEPKTSKEIHRRPKVTSTKIDLNSGRQKKSSRRPKAKMVSNAADLPQNPQPDVSSVNEKGVPVVLAQSNKATTKSSNDRGSSRRIKASRPIVVESEKIFPARQPKLD